MVTIQVLDSLPPAAARSLFAADFAACGGKVRCK